MKENLNDINDKKRWKIFMENEQRISFFVSVSVYTHCVIAQ